RKYVSEAHIVAASATRTTEKRSTRPTRPGTVACELTVGTAIVIAPLAAGAEIGRTARALRGPSFIPTVRSAPEWALRLHRVMRRRALAGFTADQGVTPLPRRPRPEYQVASEGARGAARSRGNRPRAPPNRPPPPRGAQSRRPAPAAIAPAGRPWRGCIHATGRGSSPVDGGR